MRNDEAWMIEAALTGGTISRRIGAFIADAVILLVIYKFLAVGLFIFGILTLGLGMPLFALLPLVAPLYNWISLLAFSATPGQALFGLRVRDNATLAPPGPLAALVWTVGFYVSLALSGVPLLLALLSPRRRTAHDIVSGLVVVRTRALTATLGAWNMPPGGSPYA